ncbi:hypothetical protein HanRHA438_Chr01g0040481 [Helianthus annuus]|nr:hypothetical protein HanRHA438_Chr01g0040481 [Helianthus annuus]
MMFSNPNLADSWSPSYACKWYFNNCHSESSGSRLMSWLRIPMASLGLPILILSSIRVFNALVSSGWEDKCSSRAFSWSSDSAVESAVSTAAGGGIGAATAGVRVRRERRTAATVMPVMKVVLMAESGVGLGF